MRRWRGVAATTRCRAQVNKMIMVILAAMVTLTTEDLAATISGMDSPGRLGVQDSDQAQAAVRYNRDQAAEKSFYAPKTPNMPKKNVSA